MNIHKYGRLIPRGREILVRRVQEQGLRVVEAAHASEASGIVSSRRSNAVPSPSGWS